MRQLGSHASQRDATLVMNLTESRFALARRVAPVLGRLVLVPAVVLATSVDCSWARFDDLLKNSPVQILTTPSDASAMGLSVAAMRGKSSTLALALATNSYAIYEFKDSDLSSPDAIVQRSCDAADSCWTSSSVAAVSRTIDSVDTACFGFGVETREGSLPRVLLTCEGNTVLGIDLPEPTPLELMALPPRSKPPLIHFASGPRLAPDLFMATLPTSGATWFYPAGSNTAVVIEKPSTAGKTFGNAIAVAGTGAARFLVVAEPEVGNVYVFQTDGSTAPTASICIGGSPNLGIALAAGHFTTTESEDLAVGADDGVVVVPALGDLPFNADPTARCIDLSEIPSARRISCPALNASNSCDGLLANVALAASDLDGDGREELLIGTPSASTRGNVAAGKILVTSFGEETPRLVTELSPSSGESGDRLGTSVTGVPLSRPEVVLAGAPGGNKLAAFFCSSLLGKDRGGARCD